MFSYFLSVAVAFIVFGVMLNIYDKVKSTKYRGDEKFFVWVCLFALSCVWFVAVPAAIIVLIVYLLKLLTDKIADVILYRIKNKGVKK